MPFDDGGMPLEDHFDVSAAGRTVHRIADDGLDRLQANVKRRTPIATSALYDSIERTPVHPVTTATGTGSGGTVGTKDPKAPDVEWDTVPHDIPNAFGFGDEFGIGGRFPGNKFHPGTTGQHMFALGAAETEAQVNDIARDAVEQFKREVIR